MHDNFLGNMCAHLTGYFCLCFFSTEMRTLSIILPLTSEGHPKLGLMLSQCNAVRFGLHLICYEQNILASSALYYLAFESEQQHLNVLDLIFLQR